MLLSTNFDISESSTNNLTLNDLAKTTEKRCYSHYDR